MTAPDPIDYARFPDDAEFLRSIPNHAALENVPADQRLDMARRMGLIRQHTDDGARPLVELPDGVQLGSRWRHVLTADQIREANTRGQFAHLLAGHDPDAAASSYADTEGAGTP